MRNLSMGTNGPDVRALQEGLNQRNDGIAPPIKVDGAFGPETDKAIREYQARQQLKVDGIVGPVDLLAEAKKHLEMTRASIANTMSTPMVDDPRILHVRYSDFIADQVDTVRRYYAFGGRALTAQAESAMRSYLADNRGDRHGKFRYSTQLLIDIGEDLDALHEEFRPFRERFGVAIENRG